MNVFRYLSSSISHRNISDRVLSSVSSMPFRLPLEILEVAKSVDVGIATIPSRGVVVGIENVFESDLAGGMLELHFVY